METRLTPFNYSKFDVRFEITEKESETPTIILFQSVGRLTTWARILKEAEWRGVFVSSAFQNMETNWQGRDAVDREGNEYKNEIVLFVEHQDNYKLQVDRVLEVEARKDTLYSLTYQDPNSGVRVLQFDASQHGGLFDSGVVANLNSTPFNVGVSVCYSKLFETLRGLDAVIDFTFTGLTEWETTRDFAIVVT